MTALDELIEAVETGTAPEYSMFREAHGGGTLWSQSGLPRLALSDAWRAFNGSLDAALALHEALLPGWALERLNKWPGTNGQCTAYLWGTHEEDGERWHNAKDGRVDANGPTPARAWLLAILRAYRSVQA